MYKVNEAADKLGVKRVDIFEILLSQRELFSPFVEKNNSITYISDEGIRLLKQILNIADEKASETVSTNPRELMDSDLASKETHPPNAVEKDSKGEEILAGFNYTEQGAVDRTGVNLLKASDEDLSKDDGLLDVESSDDSISLWLKEIQSEDAEADLHDESLKELRMQIASMRNKILSLDSEIKRKDDAIKHYHEIMKDDLSWLEDLERKIQLMVKHGQTAIQSESTYDADNEEDKGNFFKFFKR